MLEQLTEVLAGHKVSRGRGAGPAAQHLDFMSSMLGSASGHVVYREDSFLSGCSMLKLEKVSLLGSHC